MDNVAIHPYPSDGHAPDLTLAWKDNFSDIKMIRDYLVSVGRPVPLWVTEWGWSSAALGLATQASYVATSLEMLRSLYPYVSVATYFVDHDRPPRYYQGLLDENFALKPAGTAFSAFTAGLGG